MMKRKITITCLIAVVIIIVITGGVYFKTIEMGSFVAVFDEIDSFQITEWTGANDSEYVSDSDNTDAIRGYLMGIKLRRTISTPSEFPLLPGESYQIYGVNAQGQNVFDCKLYKGYALLNNECYTVVEPPSFSDLRDILQHNPS